MFVFSNANLAHLLQTCILNFSRLRDIIKLQGGNAEGSLALRQKRIETKSIFNCIPKKTFVKVFWHFGKKLSK